MDKNKNQHFNKLLQEQKNFNSSIIKNIENDYLDENMRSSSGELSNFDNHPADVATDMFSAEHAMGLKAMHEGNIKDIETAVQKLESGQYGFCETCHIAIDDKRLEILPHTKFCISCARELESQKKSARMALKSRPPSIDELSTPFGKKIVSDPLKERNGGMDILNDLLEFGSAQSPSETDYVKDMDD